MHSTAKAIVEQNQDDGCQPCQTVSAFHIGPPTSLRNARNPSPSADVRELVSLGSYDETKKYSLSAAKASNIEAFCRYLF